MAIHDEPRAGEIEHSLADLTAAREVLGYAPRVSLRDGLELTVEHFRALGGSESVLVAARSGWG